MMLYLTENHMQTMQVATNQIGSTQSSSSLLLITKLPERYFAFTL